MVRGLGRPLRWVSKLRSETLAQKESYLPYIDGLRGLAVLMVVVSHTAQHLGAGAFSSGTIERFVQAGDRGVQLFFILSAFTLYNSSRRRFRLDRYPQLSFYLRRAWRILPLWFAVVGFWMWYGDHSWFQGFVNASFIFGFLRFDSWFEFVPGGWTLFVEETFYFLLPFLLFFITGLRKATWLFLGLLALSFAWGYIATRVGLTTNGFMFFAPFSHWFAFGLGIMCYYLAQNKALKEFIETRKNIRLLDAGMIVLALMLLTVDYRLATIALFMICVLAASRLSLFGMIARNGLLQLYGKYCYSIYLLQFVLLIALDAYGPRIFAFFNVQAAAYEIRLLVALPFMLVTLFILATASFYLLERPCVRLGKRMVVWVNKRGGEPNTLPESIPAAAWATQKDKTGRQVA